MHAHRLRRLLDARYETEGANEPLRFTIPKGSYVLHVRRMDEVRREQAMELAHPDPSQSSSDLPLPVHTLPEARPVEAHPVRSARNIAAIGLMAGLLLGSAATCLGLHWQGRIAPAVSHSGAESFLQPPLGALWKSVFRPGSKCVVSLTNPVFLRSDIGSSRMYLIYRGPLNAPGGTELKLAPDDPLVDKRLAGLKPFYFSDSWTGTGEVTAVHKLTEMAADAGFLFRVQPGHQRDDGELCAVQCFTRGQFWHQNRKFIGYRYQCHAGGRRSDDVGERRA